jgi:DNA-binding MarR family transcriptional regulator
MFPGKASEESKEVTQSHQGSVPTLSEIPDVFFDEILIKFKLSRSEISLLMFLYRQVWCRPNLYRTHGIGPINSYTELSKILQMTSEELLSCIRGLENAGFIQTIRAGQYFVRKYFTEELDLKFDQHYEF